MRTPNHIKESAELTHEMSPVQLSDGGGGRGVRGGAGVEPYHLIIGPQECLGHYKSSLKLGANKNISKMYAVF
jgi:hypothetical protein